MQYTVNIFTLEGCSHCKTLKEENHNYYRWTFIPFMKYAYYNSKFNFNVIQGIKHYIKKKPTTLQLTGYSPCVSETFQEYNLK